MRGNGSDGWEEGWDEQEEEFFDPPAPAPRVHAGHNQQDQSRSAQTMNSARASSPVDSVASKIVKPAGIRSSFAHFRVTLLNGIGAKCNPKYIIFVIICVLALVFYMLAMGDTGKPVVSTPAVVTETPSVKQVDGTLTLTQVKELKSDIRELADASSDYEDRIKALESALGDPKSVGETPLLERLEALEEAGPSGEGGGKAGGSGGVDTATLNKIKALESIVSKLVDRVKELEDAPAAKADTSGKGGDHGDSSSALSAFMEQLSNMDDRLADVEKQVESMKTAPPAPSGEKGASDVRKEDVQTLLNTLSSLEGTIKEESKARRKMEDDLGKFNSRLSSVEHAREKMRADMMDLVKAELELEAKKAAVAEAKKAPSEEAPVNNAASMAPTAPTTSDKSKQGTQAVSDSASSSTEKAGGQVKAGDGKDQGDSSNTGGSANSASSAKKGTDADGPGKVKKAPAPAAPVDAPAKPITPGDEEGEQGSTLFSKKSDGGKSKGSKLGQDGAGQQQQEQAAPEGGDGSATAPSSKKGKKDGQGDGARAAAGQGSQDEPVEEEQGIAVGEPHPGSSQGDTSSPGGAGSKGRSATVPVNSATTHEGEAGEDGDNIGKSRMKAAMMVAQEGLADGLKDTLDQTGADPASSHGEEDLPTGSEAKAAGAAGGDVLGKDKEEGDGQQHPLSAPAKKSGKKKAH